VTVKSRDRMSALFRGQTSNEYNNTGVHLLFSRCRKTSSDASLPILLNKAFTDRKSDRFALSSEHLNLQKRTITIPKYLILSTYIMGVPSPLKISAHLTLYRWPMRIDSNAKKTEEKSICVPRSNAGKEHMQLVCTDNYQARIRKFVNTSAPIRYRAGGTHLWRHPV